MAAIDLKPYLEALVGELELVAAVLRDKGAKRFTKAFVIAGGIAFGAYALLYVPPGKKLARLEAEIAAAKKLKEHGERYKMLKAELTTTYAVMPTIKEREQWLSNAVVDSLKAENLTPESFQPVKESEIRTLIFQTATVGLPLRFADFYSWLQRLEGARPLMHVQSVNLQKKHEPMGMNSVSCEVATVIPKRRFE